MSDAIDCARDGVSCHGALMSREDTLALVQRLVDAARRRDVSQLMECYGDEAVASSPVFGDVRGRAAIAGTWERLFSTLADIHIEVSDVLIDGNRTAVLASVGITDRKGWFGLPPTGSAIAYRLVIMLTLADGKIVRDERIYDSAGVLERLEKARIDKELRTAADVQRALLSRTVHRNRFYESVGDSLPCRAIGGDFFEFVELPSGSVGVAMGDVAGKGPPAALLAAMLQGMFASEAPIAGSPAATLARINRLLIRREVESRFATLVYGVLSADGAFVYSNAGHNAPALLAAGGIRRLTTGGPILGAFLDATFEEETLYVQRGHTVVMFTDGVTEARDARGEELGEDRLMACLRANAGSPPAVLLSRIFAAVRDFGAGADQADDITVTVTQYG